MTPFLAAQADDPFDPAPMLIQADTLEEAGDPVGTMVLRGLAENGTPSLHALALGAMLFFDLVSGDEFGEESGHGYGYQRGAQIGDVYGFGNWDTHEVGAERGKGYGVGIADEFWDWDDG